MIKSAKRFKSRTKINSCYYLRCGAKTLTFMFWATLYIVVLRLTVFKSSVEPPRIQHKDWSIEPDNYTKWLLQGPVMGDDPEPEKEWTEPDNKTLFELDSRALTVQRVCREKGISTKILNSKEFFVDYDHNLIWCNIFKAASSSWLYKFNVLGGYNKKFLARTKQIPLMLARKKFPRPLEEDLRDAVSSPGVISLIVVREPFVRLLSAYRDKLENVSPLYYRKLARAIVAEHRSKTDPGAKKTYGPTFNEFVTYLITNHRNKDKQFDEHWAPYHQFCTPCAVNFSVVAKVETLARDSAFVIHELGLGHVLGRTVGDRRTRIRTVMNKSKDGRNTTALIKHYYSQLNESTLDELLEIYGLDFEMFGYDAKVYRSYVRK